MDTSATAAKLTGFGMQLLTGIDPNPDNFVCAAILHTRHHQIGCLLRLEPNKQAQVHTLDIYSLLLFQYEFQCAQFKPNLIFLRCIVSLFGRVRSLCRSKL